MKRDLYAEVTARIVAELERGAAPWSKPWSATAGRNVPQNAVTNRPYSGCNVILLWLARNRGWATPRFLTYKQAIEAGGNALTFRDARVCPIAGLIRDFEGTKQWRRLAESTKKEYKRVFAFWDAEYGTCPYRALEDKKFRVKIIRWHDKFSETKPREADNRVTIFARVLSWAAKDGPHERNKTSWKGIWHGQANWRKPPSRNSRTF